jgi:GAF domain-containing protein
MAAMPIDPDALAKSVARLEGVDPVDTGLDAALELAVAETDDVFQVDGAGLLLLDEGGADLGADPRWPSVGPLAAGHGVRAVLGVPVDLPEGPVGTLNVYAARPHRWDDADVAAIQAYTRVIASLLRTAVRAHVSGKAAGQLQRALDHRSLIEQAKGVIMERRGLDQQAAFDLLRAQARSTRRRLHDVAAEVVGRS